MTMSAAETGGDLYKLKGLYWVKCNHYNPLKTSQSMEIKHSHSILLPANDIHE
jgi:hypothetical protein